jgi:FKBP-type peptidyl-prolyl cis-trans isomerase SlyD
MAVQSNSKVHLEYSLETEDSVLEAVPKSSGFCLELGRGQMHPALEKILIGLNVGDTFEKWLDPTLTFGERNEDLKFQIHKNKISRQLPEWQIGSSFEAPGPDGKPRLFRILSTDGTRVEIDGNHPFAGIDLLFRGQIHSIIDK